ncbi:hypothetical protein [Pyrobaculum ferrireducens]|uniref:hypothetical protein n=1 Tax=Pyrobaculum ferrireducens TaxID=1104324 RepID=UPI000AA54FFA|nr:hypothetical protein [Pyrobaculum ferrireducens]
MDRRALVWTLLYSSLAVISLRGAAGPSLVLMVLGGWAVGFWPRLGLMLFTAGVLSRLVSGFALGDPWGWSRLDIALAAGWAAAWSAAHISRRFFWPGLAVLAAAGDAGVLASVLPLGVAFYELSRWRPPATVLGAAGAAAQLLALLAFGAAAVLGHVGNVFLDIYGPLVGAAALGGAAAFLAYLRRRYLPLTISAALAGSIGAYILGARFYPESTALTNVLMPALAYAFFLSAAAATTAPRPPAWRIVHASAFAALGLIAVGGPYWANPTYTKFVIAEPGTSVWTLLDPPYPSTVALLGVDYKFLGGAVRYGNCDLPRGVEAVLRIRLDGAGVAASLVYGPREALGEAPAYSVSYIPVLDHVLYVGPAAAEGRVPRVEALYAAAAGNSTCLKPASSEVDDAWYIGFRPVPAATWAMALLAVVAALQAALLFTRLRRGA